MDGNSSLGDMIGDSKQSKAIRKAIKLVDIFLPNAREARRLTGEQELPLAIQFLGELCPTVVVKDGANGSWAYADHHLIHIPAISVDPVDTTGAGDNFNAGFLYAWLEGQSIENCLKWGNVVGGLSTTVMGGTVRKVTCDEVRKYLDNWKSI